MHFPLLPSVSAGLRELDASRGFKSRCNWKSVGVGLNFGHVSRSCLVCMQRAESASHCAALLEPVRASAETAGFHVGLS